MYMSVTLLPLQQPFCPALPPPDSSTASLLPPQLQVLCTAAHTRTTSRSWRATAKHPVRARAPSSAGSFRTTSPRQHFGGGQHSGSHCIFWPPTRQWQPFGSSAAAWAPARPASRRVLARAAGADGSSHAARRGAPRAGSIDDEEAGGSAAQSPPQRTPALPLARLALKDELLPQELPGDSWRGEGLPACRAASQRAHAWNAPPRDSRSGAAAKEMPLFFAPPAGLPGGQKNALFSACGQDLGFFLPPPNNWWSS